MMGEYINAYFGPGVRSKKLVRLKGLKKLQRLYFAPYSWVLRVRVKRLEVLQQIYSKREGRLARS
jgi:hypothetical protein